MGWKECSKMDENLNLQQDVWKLKKIKTCNFKYL